MSKITFNTFNLETGEMQMKAQDHTSVLPWLRDLPNSYMFILCSNPDEGLHKLVYEPAKSKDGSLTWRRVHEIPPELQAFFAITP